MPRRIPTVDRLVVILAHHTQREAAAMFDVNPRTIRKWKSGEIKAPNAEHSRVISSVANRVKKRIDAHNRREVAVPQWLPGGTYATPVGVKRELREYRNGRWTGVVGKSNWINYDVRGYSRSQIGALFDHFVKLKVGNFQIIFDAPKDFDKNNSGVPVEDASGHKRRRRLGTGRQDIERMSLRKIAELRQKYIENPIVRVHYLGVLDVPLSVQHKVKRFR